jgi:hypothetical protein
MGVGIYPEFNPPVPGALGGVTGEMIAQDFDMVDELAEDHGLTAFTAFADNRPVPEGFNGSVDELDEIMGEWEEWFPCRDGRLAFEALAKLISTNPEAAAELDAPEAVAAELRGFAKALAVAEARGAKFRLVMG